MVRSPMLEVVVLFAAEFWSLAGCDDDEGSGNDMDNPAFRTAGELSKLSVRRVETFDPPDAVGILELIGCVFCGEAMLWADADAPAVTEAPRRRA